jgi:hypothetical protein
MRVQIQPSRRLFLAAGPAAAVFGALSQAAAQEQPSAVDQAIERHRAALDELEACCGPEDLPDDVCDRETDALWELAIAPCRSDAELIVKLRYLFAYERRNAMDQQFDMGHDGSLPICLEAHFEP